MNINRIAFTGPHSSGKTTLLNRLKEDHPEYTYRTGVTREKCASRGLPINDSANNYNNTQLFVLADHINNLSVLPKSVENTHIILERCMFDGFAYTRYLRMEGKVDEVIDKTFDYLLRTQSHIYNTVFYPEPNEVDLVLDGTRSDNVEFRNSIIKIYNDIILPTYPNIIRLSGDIETRYNIILQHL